MRSARVTAVQQQQQQNQAAAVEVAISAIIDCRFRSWEDGLYIYVERETERETNTTTNTLSGREG